MVRELAVQAVKQRGGNGVLAAALDVDQLGVLVSFIVKLVGHLTVFSVLA